MDITSIANIISAVGFPIAMCVLLSWYIYHLTAKHKDEVDTLRETVANNTLVLEKILVKLDLILGKDEP